MIVTVDKVRFKETVSNHANREALGYCSMHKSRVSDKLGVIIPSLRALSLSSCATVRRGEKGAQLDPVLRRRPICCSPPSLVAVEVAGGWGDRRFVPEACI